MIMTLIIVIDEENKKKYFAYEHSGWHHLKILSKICKYAQTAMFGTKMYKGDPSCKEIMEIMNKNSNGGLEFEEFKDFRKFNTLDEDDVSGFIIFRRTKGWDEYFNNLYINCATTESDRGSAIEQFREIIKDISEQKTRKVTK